MPVRALISPVPTTTVGSTVAVTPVNWVESLMAAALAIADDEGKIPSPGIDSEYGSSESTVGRML